MPYTVTVIEYTETNSAGIQRYTQTVDRLDLNRLIQAVNTPPAPEPPKRKKRADAGKPKTPKATTTGGHS